MSRFTNSNHSAAQQMAQTRYHHLPQMAAFEFPQRDRAIFNPSRGHSTAR